VKKGYHLVYCDVGGLLGNPEAVERWNAYYKFLVEEHGFGKKPVLEGMSRGGMIIHAVGDKDETVPVSENTAVAEKRYQEMGGTFEVIHKKDTGHHPHSLEDPAPIVDFIEKYVEKTQP
jgi:hypothetical protein